MLSICIPIYAYDVRPFVQDLQKQALQLTIEWEILLIDDASPIKWHIDNQTLAKLKGVSYTRLNSNVGRAAIRNELTRHAQHPYILFLDGDGQVETPHFLTQYIIQLQPRQILYGGRTYALSPPTNPQLYLHWYYGSIREVSSAQQRKKHPYRGFMTNNFVVPKIIMQQIPFDERITTYGHEDTLFGQALAEAQIPIVHIDNPIRHIGLEPAQVWLNKQAQAVVNLRQILRTHPNIETRLLDWWRWLNKWAFLKYPLLAMVKRFTPALRKWLLQRKPPPLWALDLLKLHWLKSSE